MVLKQKDSLNSRGLQLLYRIIPDKLNGQPRENEVQWMEVLSDAPGWVYPTAEGG